MGMFGKYVIFADLDAVKCTVNVVMRPHFFEQAKIVPTNFEL